MFLDKNEQVLKLFEYSASLCVSSHDFNDVIIVKGQTLSSPYYCQINSLMRHQQHFHPSHFRTLNLAEIKPRGGGGGCTFYY